MECLRHLEVISYFPADSITHRTNRAAAFPGGIRGNRRSAGTARLPRSKPVSCFAWLPWPTSRPNADGRLSSAHEKQLGPAGATTATAHKIAIIFYTMIKNQVEYDATLWAQADAQREKRFEQKLRGRLSNAATNWSPSMKNPPRNRLDQEPWGLHSSRAVLTFCQRSFTRWVGRPSS
jgi:hypothetical protein